MLLAYKCALASPRVSAAGIEASEFAAEADRFGVWAVPKIVINDVPRYEGAVPERVFLERLAGAMIGE